MNNILIPADEYMQLKEELADWKRRAIIAENRLRELDRSVEPLLRSLWDDRD